MKINYLLLTALCGILAPFGVVAQTDTNPEPAKQMRTWLGVATSEVHPVLRKHLELDEGFGVLVSHIPEESPAAAAGLKAGDVLTVLDDQILTTPEHLAILVRSKNKGDTVELTYLRKGEKQTASVTLGEHEMPKHDMRRPFPNPITGSPEHWKDWHGEMRRHKEEFDRRMEDIRNRVPNRPGLVVPNPGNYQRKGPAPQPKRNLRGQKDPGPKPMMNNESTVKIENDQGEVMISQKNGKGRIEIIDSEGNDVYSGPFDTEKGVKGLPEKAQKHLKEMKVDNIDMLAPTPVPIPPKPDMKKLEEAL